MVDSPSPETEESNLDQQRIPEGSSASDNQDMNTEDSSTSKESEKELSTFDIVKSAIQGKDSDDDAEGSSEKDEPTKDKDKSEKDKSKSEEGESDEISEEELKDYKPKTRKRIEQLQGLYKEAKTQATELKQRLDEVENDAGLYKQYTGYLERNHISQDEANELFQIGALMKSDPVKALNMIAPHYNKLLEVTGNVLTPELQKQVDDGYITREVAIELNRNKAQNIIHQQRFQQQQQQEQLAHQTQDQQKLITSIQTTIANIENGWQTSDPDYAKKAARIRDRIELKWHKAHASGKIPRSGEEASRMMEEVKREVDQEFRDLMPKRQPVDTVPGGGSTQVVAEPKSTLDVIRNALSG